MGVTGVGWALTVGVIVALLAVDLLLATVRPHAVGYREAAVWSVFYIAVAVVFGLVLASRVGWGYGSQYFAGYVVEKSLSVDNLFVFVIIMATFAVPREHQQRVLIFGIIAALALRAVFIALGAALLSLLSFMFLLFGLLLLWTAVRLYRHREEDPDVGDNALVRASRRILPVTDAYDGGRLISRAGGRRVVTPLFIVFITIGGTDILFALDSIPAVFGVTDQPYIVFAANAFALLGLRALFFLVTGLLDRLVYLSSGPGADPGVHRREADPALGSRARSPGAGDHHRGVAGCHSSGAGRHHSGQPHQIPARSRSPGARRGRHRRPTPGRHR